MEKTYTTPEIYYTMISMMVYIVSRTNKNYGVVKALSLFFEFEAFF